MRITLSSIIVAATLSFAALNAQALPTNLLPNSNFSTGLGAWSTQYTGPNGGSPTCCAGPFHVTAPGTVYGDFDGMAGGGINFHESINLTGGYADAALSFTYRGDGSYSGADRTLAVIIRDATNTIDQATLFFVSVPASAFNVDHVVSLTGLQSALNALSAGVHEFNFYEFTPQTYSGPGDMQLSNISFTAAVPEPASLALVGLALAALAFARRKRAN